VHAAGPGLGRGAPRDRGPRALAALRPARAEGDGELDPHAGVLNPEVRQETIGRTICVAGWTRTIRPPAEYTSRLKERQLAEYGLAGDPADYQEDHLVSLELGGDPRDPRNLWPEPKPRALAVDRIENQLHADVCSGRLTLAEAQRRISAVKHRSG
jgi:hypothetical protein